MTSLEHESNDTSASASDYGNNDWDNENWGEMDVSINQLLVHSLLLKTISEHILNTQTSQDPSSPMAGSPNNGPLSANTALTEVRDGWDNEEWGSLEEDPVSIL